MGQGPRVGAPTLGRTGAQGGVSTETRQSLLPRPVHTLDDQRADIKFRMSGRMAAGVVGDVSQTHGFVGKGRNAG
eukprot:3122519-Rhodomonas_salina.1